MVESRKEYVQAAQMIGRKRRAILIQHLLPNVMSPVLVIGTISLALAIILEATLSFLGVGAPPTKPSTWAAAVQQSKQNTAHTAAPGANGVQNLGRYNPLCSCAP